MSIWLCLLYIYMLSVYGLCNMCHDAAKHLKMFFLSLDARVSLHSTYALIELCVSCSSPCPSLSALGIPCSLLSSFHGTEVKWNFPISQCIKFFAVFSFFFLLFFLLFYCSYWFCVRCVCHESCASSKRKFIKMNAVLQYDTTILPMRCDGSLLLVA